MQLLNELNLVEALDLVDQLDEDFSWDAGKPLEGQLDQAVKQMEAAQRALGIANRFKDPALRTKHKSRIMGMLNKLRASLLRLYTAIDGEIEAMRVA